MSVNDRQVGGTHYKTGGVEHWDFVLECLDGKYLEGCATKYICRHKNKNGREDLLKARHYVEKILETGDFSRTACKPIWTPHQQEVLREFSAPYDHRQLVMLLILAGWKIREDLLRLLSLLDEYTEQQYPETLAP